MSLENNEKPIMVAEGRTGQVELYKDRVIITRKGILAKLNHWNKGSKEISLEQIASIQLKESGLLTAGYIRFGQSGYMESKGGVFSAAKDENSVTFNKDQDFKALKNKINKLRKKKEKDKSKNNESALEKLKQKLVQNEISEEEFKRKKKLLEE